MAFIIKAPLFPGGKSEGKIRVLFFSFGHGLTPCQIHGKPGPKEVLKDFFSLKKSNVRANFATPDPPPSTPMVWIKF